MCISNWSQVLNSTVKSSITALEQTIIEPSVVIQTWHAYSCQTASGNIILTSVQKPLRGKWMKSSSDQQSLNLPNLKCRKITYSTFTMTFRESLAPRISLSNFGVRIFICGAHSTGKTTLFNSILDHEFISKRNGILHGQPEIARKIIHRMGNSYSYLHRINLSPPPRLQRTLM